VRHAIEVRARGMYACLDDVRAWLGGRDLAAFLDELVVDFRGWDGTRVWQTFDRDLTVGAVHRSGGHVGLTWRLRPWRAADGGWDAAVTTWLEAGEQLSTLATDLRYFLNQDTDR
jgi:hypothetical protein